MAEDISHDRGEQIGRRPRKRYVVGAKVVLANKGLEAQDLKSVLSMVRGLVNSLVGYDAVSGWSNKKFMSKGTGEFGFPDLASAKTFRSKAKRLFSPHVVSSLKISISSVPTEEDDS